jgi:type VI secretion system Hcp family effector
MTFTFRRTKATQLLSALLLTLPIQASAGISIAACFSGNTSIPKGQILVKPYVDNLCIVVGSISYGATIPIEIEEGGKPSRPGSPAFSELSIHKSVDASTPPLLLEMLTRNKYDTLKIDFYDTNQNFESPVIYMQLLLKNVYISSINTQVDLDGSLVNKENVSFKFEEIETKAFVFDEKTGGTKEGSKSCWSIIKATTCK